ncbi:hypothetical protein G7968_16630 [Ralstonia solanacearum]|nr:hypothetical protein G7968_16630 [Ralstonia solanacearum]
MLSDVAQQTGTSKAQQETGLGELTTSFGLSLGATSVLSALLVILKETHESSVLAWMKAATGHHWVTHGMLDVLVFILLGFALRGLARRLQSRPAIVTTLALGGVVVGALLVAGFYSLD